MNTTNRSNNVAINELRQPQRENVEGYIRQLQVREICEEHMNR